MDQDIYSRFLSEAPVKKSSGQASAGPRVETAGESGASIGRRLDSIEMARPRVQINENGRRVLEKRYLKKKLDGTPTESIEDMFWRVASNIAQAEKVFDPSADTEAVAEEFYAMMTGLEFMPNSPTLMNAGRELQQLSACFVLPVEDSMESIFEAVKNTALIHKSGGGTGFSFSRLRPSGDSVGSTSGISSGPISFMTVFDSATEAIKQGGTRRGANMGILRVDHPDILNFIFCKGDNSKLNNFNISVNLTEDFMEAVKKNSDYDLINPKDGSVAGSLNARDVFNKIVKMAWSNGEPGIIFIDQMNADNPTPRVGAIESTNPCGEQPLLPYESCNLGSINLSVMLKKGDGGGLEVDWERLEATVARAVRFLDDVIEMNRYPIKQIDEVTRSNRKIGLGVMGFADMLIRLGVPYNSLEATGIAEEIMGFIQSRGREASVHLAGERGAFPNYKGSIYDGGPAPRNATVTTIAPTGTISIISGCSSGIEPLFALAFTRNVMEGTELIEVNPLFEEFARARGFDSPEVMKQVAEKGTLHGVEGVPDDVKEIFVTAHDISPEWHIKMQAAFQKYTDNAVSKTVNFPKEATEADVAEVYLMAYRLGCKGITVYRDGSRDAQVLTRGSEKQAAPVAEAAIPAEIVRPSPSPRPKTRGEVAFGVTRKIKTGCGNLYVTINEDEEGHPIEIFTQIGKAGGCVASQCESMGRLTSLALRSGVKADEIVKQMRGISCHLPVGFGGGKVTSCADAMAKAMDWYLGLKRSTAGQSFGSGAVSGENGHKLDFTLASEINKRGACPDCGGTVEHSDGCLVCRGCGYSEC